MYNWLSNSIAATIVFAILATVITSNSQQQEEEIYHPTEKKGIYCRWEKSSLYSAHLRVWCKDADCGHIYARVNFIDQTNTVIGWAEDSAYAKKGQEVLLDFKTQDQVRQTVEMTDLKFTP